MVKLGMVDYYLIERTIIIGDLENGLAINSICIISTYCT